MSNIPVGAGNDPNAPYNEIDYTREFTITVSSSWTISGKPDMTDEEIHNEIEDQIYKHFNNYIIDDLFINDSNAS